MPVSASQWMYMPIFYPVYRKKRHTSSPNYWLMLSMNNSSPAINVAKSRTNERQDLATWLLGCIG